MLSTTPGRSYPIGATICAEGVHFCVYSKHATSVELALFDHETDADPAHIIRLDSAQNRSWYYWHVTVHGIGAGQIYGYRVHGPNDPGSMATSCSSILTRCPSSTPRTTSGQRRYGRVTTQRRLLSVPSSTRG